MRLSAFEVKAVQEMMETHPKISDQLKEALRDCGFTLMDIYAVTGIAPANVSRLLSDDPEQHRNILLEGTADKLAAFLGLKLVPIKSYKLAIRRPKKKPAKGRKRPKSVGDK